MRDNIRCLTASPESDKFLRTRPLTNSLVGALSLVEPPNNSYVTIINSLWIPRGTFKKSLADALQRAQTAKPEKVSGEPGFLKLIFDRGSLALGILQGSLKGSCNGSIRDLEGFGVLDTMRTRD